MSASWLPTLQTENPQQGYELAIKLSRMAVKLTQPDEKIRGELRTVYERDAAALVEVSGVVAVNFQTIAAANAYWRD